MQLTNGQVAVFYASTSGALLSKIVTGPGEKFDITPPPNQSVLIVEKGDAYDDVACYELIKKASGLIVDHMTDHCAVVGTDNVVIDFQKRDPIIHPVQEGEVALVPHKHAGIGDTWVGDTNFKRRVVVYHRATGLVHDVQVIDVTADGVAPVNMIQGQHGVTMSMHLQIGDKYDI
jgi:hypothetical protein